MRIKVFTLTLALGAIVLMNGYANAGLVAGGSTRPDGTDGFGSIDGSISFAVFDRSGESMNDFGTGLGAALDTAFTGSLATGKYLYLYQVVNDSLPANGGTDLEISSATISLGHLLPTPSSHVISSGSFASLTFFDSGASEVGVGGNNALGTPDPPAFATPPEPAPATIDFGLTSSIVGTTGASPVTPSISLTGSSLVATFSSPLFLASGASSVLFGFTSDVAPFFGTVDIHDGGTSTTGTVLTLGADGIDTPLPEPGSLALLLTGLPGLGIYLRRRRNSLQA